MVFKKRNRLALAYDRFPEGILTRRRRNSSAVGDYTVGRATSWVFNAELLIMH